MRYYYADEANAPAGPVTMDDLLGLKSSGVIAADTMVIEEGAESWEPFTDAALRHTRVRAAAPPAPVPAPPPPLPAERSFYYLDASRAVAGPVPEALLADMFRSGQLPSGTLVAEVGNGGWSPYAAGGRVPSPKVDAAREALKQSTRDAGVALARGAGAAAVMTKAAAERARERLSSSGAKPLLSRAATAGVLGAVLASMLLLPLVTYTLKGETKSFSLVMMLFIPAKPSLFGEPAKSAPNIFVMLSFVSVVGGIVLTFLGKRWRMTSAVASILTAITTFLGIRLFTNAVAAATMIGSSEPSVLMWVPILGCLGVAAANVISEAAARGNA